MKVILLEDIKGLGTRGDVCAVSDGYAMNFLIPRKQAIGAREAKGNAVLKEKQDREHQRAERDSEDRAAFENLPTTVTLVMPANEQGVLFQAVTPATLVEYLKGQGMDVPVKWFSDVTIKNIGEHTVTAQCGSDEKALHINVQKI